MEAINKTERTTSIINFSAIYLIIVIIPICVAFFAGNRQKAGAASAASVLEYEKLKLKMTEFQSYTTKMKELDTQLPAMSATSPEQWRSWLSEAKRENQRFGDAIEKFRRETYTDSRKAMQISICTYLDALHRERLVHLDYLELQHGYKNEKATVEKLQNEKQQLQNDKQQLQNTVNLQQTMLAQKSSGGGGGAESQALTDLIWQLRFEVADGKKKQGDLLEAYNDAARRRLLYSAAKTNYQKIAQLALTNAVIQRQVNLKVKEIDQLMNRL